MGLEFGSYEAYCLDEAVTYFGLTVESELDKASYKPTKEDRKAETARKSKLDSILDDGSESSSGSGYADPALMF